MARHGDGRRYRGGEVQMARDGHRRSYLKTGREGGGRCEQRKTETGGDTSEGRRAGEAKAEDASFLHAAPCESGSSRTA